VAADHGNPRPRLVRGEAFACGEQDALQQWIHLQIQTNESSEYKGDAGLLVFLKGSGKTTWTPSHKFFMALAIKRAEDAW